MSTLVDRVREKLLNSLQEVTKGKVYKPGDKNYPNKDHPAHVAAVAAAKAAKPKAENPVSIHDLHNAIGSAYPDAEPYDHLAKKFPDLHNKPGKTGSKLMDYMHATAKKHGHGDFHKMQDNFFDDLHPVHEASKSPAQARLMAACAHGADYESCPPMKVAKDFNQADKGTSLLSDAMKSKVKAKLGAK